MNTPKWHVLQNTLGQWYWHKRSGNGEITATAQAFASKQGALRAVTRDAFPWFESPDWEYGHSIIIGWMNKKSALVIHPAQKRLSVEDLKVGMQVRAVFDAGDDMVGVAKKEHNKWVVRDDASSFLTLATGDDFWPDIVSVTEVTK